MQVSPPVDLYAAFSFFHVLNADELNSTNWAVKPKVVEVGPYCYSEYYEKRNIVELNTEHLSYDSSVEWTWDQAETDRCENNLFLISGSLFPE